MHFSDNGSGYSLVFCQLSRCWFISLIASWWESFQNPRLQPQPFLLTKKPWITLHMVLPWHLINTLLIIYTTLCLFWQVDHIRLYRNQSLVANVFSQLSITGLSDLLNFCHSKLGRGWEKGKYNLKQKPEKAILKKKTRKGTNSVRGPGEYIFVSSVSTASDCKQL